MLRSVAVLILCSVPACGDDGGGGTADAAAPDQDAEPAADSAPEAPTFQILSGEVMVPAGAEFVSCFYFRPAMEGLRIRSIRSRATGPVVDITLFSTVQDVMPPGTQTGVNCGWLQNHGIAGKWLYSSYQAEDEYTFPADDGSGRPIGLILSGETSAYLRIHSINLDFDAPAIAQVELELEGYPAGTDITAADSLLAHADDIEITSGTTATVTHTCPMPSGIQFTSLSTFSHKHSVHTFLEDTAAVVFESTQFANPGATRPDAAPFVSLAGDVLTYRCDYDNQTNLTIRDGDSPAVDENCIALGYFFPADAPIRCVNDARL